MLAYYDGHDVTTADGRSEWQRATFGSITLNGKIASVKTDMLPRDGKNDRRQERLTARTIDGKNDGR